MKLLIALLLFSATSWADPGWTLNNSVGARYKKDKVKVRVARVSGNCNGQSTSADELVGLVNSAVQDFWNTIPTSRLQLEDGGFLETSDNAFITGELCLIGGACGGAPIPAVSEIVITCNTNGTNFPGGTSLLALTLPTVISSRDIKGSVIAINANNNSFGSLSREKKIAVIAHEIGHAIGLGHTSKSENLMYHSVVPVRDKLGQGDVDGLTWLYPVQLDMYGLGCFLGTIAAGKGPTDSPSSWWPTLLLGALLGLILAKKKNPRKATV